MTAPANQLHCYLPGLLGPFGPACDATVQPRVPVLERLLARADPFPSPGVDHLAALAHAFDLPADAQLPSAALCLLGDAGEPDDGYWLHADPVHLRPDMDRLLMFDNRALDIRLDEARDLALRINEHFQPHGWQLQVATAQRWYLRVPRVPKARMHPLHDVAGRNILAFLPEGEEATRWHAWLNELQMLLFEAAPNQSRREQGRPEINGVWLWGGGVLPPRRPARWQRLHGDDALIRGLARWHGLALDAASWPTDVQGRELILKSDLLPPVMDADTLAWQRALEALEPWLESLTGCLRSKRLETLTLYPCNGCAYRITSGVLTRRFWRRGKPIVSLIGPLAAQR